MENSISAAKARSWLTRVDLPEPDGAEMMNRIPANLLPFIP
jgi:hypothetical protein